MYFQNMSYQQRLVLEKQDLAGKKSEGENTMEFSRVLSALVIVSQYLQTNPSLLLGSSISQYHSSQASSVLHNYIMQIKQLKTLINTHFLSPWDEDFDLDEFLAPPQPQPPPKNPQKPLKQQPPSSPLLDKSIQQQAKKTLLNLATDEKQQKTIQLKSYLHKKSKMKLEKMWQQEEDGLKLPAINSKVYNNVDYYNGYINAHQYGRGNLQEIDVFRKYGDHRKGKRESRVERSFSLGGEVPSQMRDMSQKKQKIATLEPISAIEKLNESQLKGMKLKGKKYSFDSRVESERRLNIDKYNYIPSQPNITPHYLLFGHNKEDILKKVLQQINQKVK